MNTHTITEIQPQMPRFNRQKESGEKAVNLIWQTDSGSGSTLLYVRATNWTDAFALAREHFRQWFTGYRLIAVSIA